MIAIERGILERLRHQRTGELLHLEGEAAHARRAVQRPAAAGSGPSSAYHAEIHNALVGGEPVGARSFDGFEINARSLPEAPAEER